MHNVLFDARGKTPPQRPLNGFEWIGGAHQRPNALYRPFPLENHDHTRTGGHKAREAPKEWLVSMHLIESLSLFLRQPHHLQPTDHQPLRFKSPNDLTNKAPSYSIRFHND